MFIIILTLRNYPLYESLLVPNFLDGRYSTVLLLKMLSIFRARSDLFLITSTQGNFKLFSGQKERLPKKKDNVISVQRWQVADMYSNKSLRYQPQQNIHMASPPYEFCNDSYNLLQKKISYHIPHVDIHRAFHLFKQKVYFIHQHQSFLNILPYTQWIPMY